MQDAVAEGKISPRAGRLSRRFGTLRSPRRWRPRRYQQVYGRGGEPYGTISAGHAVKGGPADGLQDPRGVRVQVHGRLAGAQVVAALEQALVQARARWIKN